MAGSSDSDIELRAEYKDSTNGDTFYTSTTANMVENTWYFVELAWKKSTNYMEIFVNGSSKGTASGTLSAAWDGTLSSVNFGDVYYPGTGDHHMDNIMLSDSSTENLYSYRDNTSYPFSEPSSTPALMYHYMNH